MRYPLMRAECNPLAIEAREMTLSRKGLSDKVFRRGRIALRRENATLTAIKAEYST
jgi:hypothetical protein